MDGENFESLIPKPPNPFKAIPEFVPNFPNRLQAATAAI